MSKVVVMGSFAGSLINFRGPLLREMVGRGHEVLACAPDASPDLQENGVMYRSIPIDRTGLNPVRDIYTICRLISLFREVKPDVILGYTIKPVIYGSIAGRIAGVPRIFSMITGLGYAFSDGGLKEWLVGAVVRFLYKLGMGADRRVFFQNPDDRDFFIKQNLIRDFEQSALINGSGVDVDFFQPASFPEKVSFLLIARLIKDKGILEYVKAAGILHKDYPFAHFLLCGDGISWDNPSLNTWIDEANVRPVTHLLGRWDDMPSLQAALDIASSSSSWGESFPNVVGEAMACGVPCVVTDVGDSALIVGETGRSVSPRNPEGLAQGWREFINMGAEGRKRLGALARQRIDEHFSLDTVAKKYESLYESVVP